MMTQGKEKRSKKPLCLRAFAVVGVTLLTLPVFAQAQAPALATQSVVVMDATTGTIVFEKNPDDEIPPASLTKLMTMHLAFREIAAGRASPDEIINPPRESWTVNQLPRSSVMGLANGQRLSLNELFLGMAVFSGNDAATAVALRFAPSVDAFVEMMNREARGLGLPHTRFVDASGYSEENMTTAREFTEFCRVYLQAHPHSLADYHSVREFAYPKVENFPGFGSDTSGNPARVPTTRLHSNNNNLLGKVEGVDGLKTGYIPESGYNIAITAERGGTRFIAVLLGAPSEWGGDRLRDEDGRKIIEWAFANYRTVKLDIGAMEAVRVWKGKENYVGLVPASPLRFTTLAERGEEISWHVTLREPIIAPLPARSPVGDLVIYDRLGELRNIPLVTVRDMEKGGFFKWLFDSIRLFFRRTDPGH